MQNSLQRITAVSNAIVNRSRLSTSLSPVMVVVVIIAWSVWLPSAPSALVFAAHGIPSNGVQSNDAPSSDAPQTSDLTELIEQLGASRFSDRERASKQLLDMGLGIFDSLQDRQDHPDRETRLRIRALLDSLVELDRRAKLADFIAGRTDEQTILPSWNQFCAITGDSPASRQLMADMLRDNWELLADAEAGEISVSDLLVRRCEDLQHALSVRREEVGRADVATMLLLAVNPDVGVYKNTQQQIYNFCYRVRISPSSDAEDPLRKLLGAWVARPGDVANTAFYSLNIALRYSLTEGLVPATQILDDESAAPYIRQYAILTVARFNDQTSRDKLESLLTDESICSSQTDPRTKNVAFQSQIRDVALATLIHLDGGNPGEFGFQRLRTSPSMVYQPNTLGFESAEQRTKAFADYRQRQEELADSAGDGSMIDGS